MKLRWRGERQLPADRENNVHQGTGTFIFISEPAKTLCNASDRFVSDVKVPSSYKEENHGVVRVWSSMWNPSAWMYEPWSQWSWSSIHNMIRPKWKSEILDSPSQPQSDAWPNLMHKQKKNRIARKFYSTSHELELVCTTTTPLTVGSSHYPPKCWSEMWRNCVETDAQWKEINWRSLSWRSNKHKRFCMTYQV